MKLKPSFAFRLNLNKISKWVTKLVENFLKCKSVAIFKTFSFQAWLKSSQEPSTKVLLPKTKGFFYFFFKSLLFVLIILALSLNSPSQAFSTALNFMSNGKTSTNNEGFSKIGNEPNVSNTFSEDSTSYKGGFDFLVKLVKDLPQFLLNPNVFLIKHFSDLHLMDRYLFFKVLKWLLFIALFFVSHNAR